jgi:DNA-binding transcriptional LysR family regulator
VDFDLQHLRTLVEFERRGSMRAVAEATGYSTSAVSAQLSALQRDAGVSLLEPSGRKVRLTPAGNRLVEHARSILAAADAARLDLTADAPIAGRLRVAAYASALGGDVLAATLALHDSHPDLQVELQEREPDETFPLLLDGAIDVGFTYDYTLAPHAPRAGVQTQVLCHTPMLLAVPEGLAMPDRVRDPDELRALAGRGWVLNSRGHDDDELVTRVAARAGFTPEIRHRADAYEVVLRLVAADLGVSLVAATAPAVPGVRLIELGELSGSRRMSAATRAGQAGWPPVALMVRLVTERAAGAGPELN